MGIPIRELRSRITAAEFVKYMAFSLLEPFGDARDDDRARGMMAAIYGAQGVKTRPDDFLPTYEPPQQPSAADDLAAFVARMDGLAVWPDDVEG